MDEQLERNEAVARKLVLSAVVVPAVVLELVLLAVVYVLVGWLPSLLLVVFVVAMVVYAARRLRRDAAGSVLVAVGARPVSEADEPRLHNLVEGLCVGIGLAPPRLHVVESGAANALAVARSIDDSDLVVTRGLLARLSRVELEAVLAHELARIRRGDAIVGPLAGATLSGVRVPGLPLVAVAAPLTRAIVSRGEPIETWTDLAAVEITRYPPALASALQKLAEDADPLPGPVPTVAHQWIHGARAEGAFGEALVRVYEPVPPVGQRIEVLEEL